MPETLTLGIDTEQDVVDQASKIVEAAKGEQIDEFFKDGRYLPRQIIDSKTGLFIELNGKTRSEVLKELQELREADID